MHMSEVRALMRRRYQAVIQANGNYTRDKVQWFFVVMIVSKLYKCIDVIKRKTG